MTHVHNMFHISISYDLTSNSQKFIISSKCSHKFFGVCWLQKQAGTLVQPPKVLLVRSSPMDRTAQVVHPRSLPVVPLHNIRIVLGTLADSSPKLPPGNPEHTKNKAQINVYRSKICITKDFVMWGTCANSS
jgi:hypothetical protein